MHRNRLVTTVVGIVMLTGVSGASSVEGATLRCHGQKATIVGKGRVVGTAKRDVFVLTAASNVKASGGDDLICGSRGNDIIDAGAGNDVVYGGAGNDVLVGGPGDDMLMGEAGVDTIDGKREATPVPSPTPSSTATPNESASPTPTPTVSVDPADVVLTISGFTFSKVSVKAGSTVTIRNSDGVDHTVTIAAQGIDVGIAAGEVATFVAPKTPGTYTLTCDLHPSMKGTLVVVA